MTQAGSTSQGLRRYLQILRKHRRIAITAALTVPLAAFAYSVFQPAAYEATADVLLDRQNIAANLTGLQDPAGVQFSDRVVQTEADLARVPTVVDRTLKAAKHELSIEAFLASSSVGPKTNSDLLEFKVVSADRFDAARLATEYARQFTRYRLELDTTPTKRARAQLQKRIEELRLSSESKTALYTNLRGKEQELATFEALQTSKQYLVTTPQDAIQVQPRLKRTTALGVGVGIMLALALVAIAHALDTRVSTVGELEAKLGLPLLARVATSSAGSNGTLIMRVEPSDTRADVYRVLRANLDFVNREQGARVIMMTSAIEGEGKSTTVANLAIAYALEGRRVIVIDLDVRRPAVARLFDIPERPGVVDFVWHGADLEQVLHPVRSDDFAPGALRIVPAGEVAEDVPAHAHFGRWNPTLATAAAIRRQPAMAVGEIAASERLRHLLHEASEQADLVFVDAPPLLATSDAITLGSTVDGVILVTEVDRLRWETLDDVTRALSMCPAPLIGWVVTGTAPVAEYGSYAAANGRRR
ncbi:polysaccharide biosynthesis tyrosine autokinase [soil metagenome]